MHKFTETNDALARFIDQQTKYEKDCSKNQGRFKEEEKFLDDGNMQVNSNPNKKERRPPVRKDAISNN